MHGQALWRLDGVWGNTCQITMISHAFNLPNIKWRKRGNLRILQDHKHRSAYEGDPKINDPSNSVHERDLSNKVGFYFEVPVQKGQKKHWRKDLPVSHQRAAASYWPTASIVYLAGPLSLALNTKLSQQLAILVEPTGKKGRSYRGDAHMCSCCLNNNKYLWMHYSRPVSQERGLFSPKKNSTLLIYLQIYLFFKEHERWQQPRFSPPALFLLSVMLLREINRTTVASKLCLSFPLSE